MIASADAIFDGIINILTKFFKTIYPAQKIKNGFIVHGALRLLNIRAFLMWYLKISGEPRCFVEAETL